MVNNYYQKWFVEPATPIQDGIIHFHDELMVVLTFVITFVGISLFLLVSYDLSGKMTLRSINVHGLIIESIWTIIPGLILGFVTVLSFALFYTLSVTWGVIGTFVGKFFVLDWVYYLINIPLNGKSNLRGKLPDVGNIKSGFWNTVISYQRRLLEVKRKNKGVTGERFTMVKFCQAILIALFNGQSILIEVRPHTAIWNIIHVGFGWLRLRLYIDGVYVGFCHGLFDNLVARLRYHRFVSILRLAILAYLYGQWLSSTKVSDQEAIVQAMFDWQTYFNKTLRDTSKEVPVRRINKIRGGKMLIEFTENVKPWVQKLKVVCGGILSSFALTDLIFVAFFDSIGNYFFLPLRLLLRILSVKDLVLLRNAISASGCLSRSRRLGYKRKTDLAVVLDIIDKRIKNKEIEDLSKRNK